MKAATASLMMIAAAGSPALGQGVVLKADNPVRNQYIVTLREEALLREAPEGLVRLPAKSAAAELARKRRFQVGPSFESALKGFVARMDAAEAEALAQDPAVESVEEDAYVEVAGSQAAPPSWGLDRVDQRTVPLDATYLFNNEGSGVDVYVIDSGIRSTHVEFGGRVDTVKAFTAFADGMGTEDCFGHGTMVAGVIGAASYGVAKSVTLHPVRVVDCNGQGTISSVVAGIDWITSQYATSTTTTRRGKTSTTTRRPAVANIALITGGSSAIDAAVNNSINAGVTYVVAAGNSAADACGYSPARVSNAVTVGASNDADNAWIYSNGGACVDVFAPGYWVSTTLSRSDTDVVASFTGTSAAAPHVAGAAALYLAANPAATPMAVASSIINDATAGALAALPANTPNRLLYTARAGLDQKPIARFNYVCSGRRCTFNATASSDDKGITSFSWGFGDGGTATGAKPSHRFPSTPSSFQVTLTVTDTAGQQGTMQQVLTF